MKPTRRRPQSTGRTNSSSSTRRTTSSIAARGGPPRKNQQQQQHQEQEEDHPDFQQQKQDIGSCSVKMCPMINVLISPDHGLSHDCAEAVQVNSNFDATHEVITYMLAKISTKSTYNADMDYHYNF